MKKFLFSILLFMAWTSVHASGDHVVRIWLDKPYDYDGGTTFIVVNLDTGEEGKFCTDSNYKELIIPEEVNRLKIYEIDRDPHYLKNNTIYFIDLNKTPEYTIYHSYELWYIDVYWYAVYINTADDNSYVGYYNPKIEIYDEIGRFEQEEYENNAFMIRRGKYIIKDTQYNKDYEAEFYERDEKLMITQKVINGLQVNDKIDSICDDNKCYEFSQDNDLITFSDYLLPGEYLINGISYFLNDESPVVSDIKENIVVIDLPINDSKEEKPKEEVDSSNNDLKSDDDIKEDMETNNDEEIVYVSDYIDEDYIIIDVPNTGIDNSEITYYVKKEYYI